MVSVQKHCLESLFYACSSIHIQLVSEKFRAGFQMLFEFEKSQHHQ